MEKKKIRLRTPTAEEQAMLEKLIPIRSASIWEVVRDWLPGSSSTGLLAFPTPWGWRNFLHLCKSEKYSKDELEMQIKKYWEKIGYDGSFLPLSEVIDKDGKELFN